jgi:thiol-disulfide isomerase/thioredoxin
MRTLRPLLVTCIVLTAVSAHSETSRLRIAPACPVAGMADQGTKEIHVIYSPGNPAATIKNPKQLELEAGIDGEFNPDNTRSAPFTAKDDGTWQATLTRGEREFWLYLIFEVKETGTGQIDDNHGDYWDVVLCDPDGQRNFQGVEEQARDYTGYHFDNGISRKEDYAKAVSVLEEFMKTPGPDRYSSLFFYWEYKVHRDGNNDAAWQKVSTEIAQFIDDHQLDLYALDNAFGFVNNRGKHLRADLYPKLLRAIEVLDRDSAANLDRSALFGRIRRETDIQKRADALATFVQKYPNDPEAPWAAAERFNSLRQLHDINSAELLFPQLVQYDPYRADTYVVMAAVYIESSQKADQALKLLDQAEQLGSAGKRDWSPQIPFFAIASPDPTYTQTSLAYWRARAFLLQDKGDLALPLAEKVIGQRKHSAEYFLLAQAYESVGEKQKAVDAYFEALALPSEESEQQQGRLERLWIGGGFGTKEQLEGKVQGRLDEAFRKANYVPRFVDRPASEYEFTTLAGEKFRSVDLQDKTVVLNFWGTWCSPCLPELPGFQRLQRKHPDLVVAALAISSERETLDRLIKVDKLEGLRVAQGDSLKPIFGVAGVPVTFIIYHGHIRVVHHNALPNVVSYIEADIAALQKEQAPRN